MNKIATAIERARAKVAAASSKFLPDKFTVKIPGTSTTDEFGVPTESVPTEHKNIPGEVEPMGHSDRVVGGAQITNQDHVIKMGVTVITRNIKKHHQLVRQAQGDQAEEVYENPVVLLGSKKAFVRVAAVLVR